MLHKNFSLLEVKAEGDSGEFTAIVSTFGNVDRVGDRIMPGAWTKTLAQWRASGDPVPIILAHQWDDPFAHVGVARAEDIKQVAKGLQVTGKLDVEDNPVAKQVHKLMKRRSLKEFSIGYDVPVGGERRAKDGANEINQINLAECGPCLKGIDPKTELQGVKSALGVEVPRTAAALREDAKRLEREIEGHQLPDVPAESSDKPDLAGEVDSLKTQLAETRQRLDEVEREPPKDAEALRREAKRVEREIEGERLPHVPAAPEVDFAAELAAVKADLAETQAKLIEATREPPKDAKTLRDEATRAAREIEQQQIPDVPEQPKAPEVDVIKELQEIKGLLAATRVEVESLKKKADEAAKEPARARAVDPLRKQADTVALEIASDGQSLRKPPKTVVVQQPEPSLSLRELRQRTRDEMLGVLSGGINEQV